MLDRMNDRPVSHRVRTRAGEVVVDELGSGPTVLLLPAAAHLRGDWDLVRPALAAEFRTIAVDWPGHGDSPAPDPGWAATAAGFADVVEDVVDHVRAGDEPVGLLGNSVGGFAAARFAARRPADAGALVLVDSGGFVPITALVRAFGAAMGRPAVLHRIYPWFSRWYMRDASPFGARVRAAAIATARRPGTTELLSALWRSFSTPAADVRREAAAITAPTLAVWGARDPVLPTRVGRIAADAVPGARMVVLDTGHVPFASRPDAFTSAVVPFLRAAAAARCGSDRAR